MNPEELSFEAYVVVGNALHLLVHGVNEHDQQRLALPMNDLRRLHAWLEPVPANEMLGSLGRLPDKDRQLLAEALFLCERLANADADSLLGAPAAIRKEVTQALSRSSHSTGVSE